jgi:hypothetical protein
VNPFISALNFWLKNKNSDMKKYITVLLISVVILTQSACEKVLDVTPPSEFSSINVLANEAGIRSVLYSAYANLQNPTPSRWIINNTEVTTDMAFNTGGGENLALVQLINFTWDASLGTFRDDVWAPCYRGIRDANIVIESIDQIDMPDATKKLYTAEAKFLRAYAYDLLYKWFGPVPLRLSSKSPSQLARATDDEMKNIITSDLTEAIPDLPNPGTEAAFARATKGSAIGILAKFYLNTKQWQKAADACQQIMAFNYYQLYPAYENMFRVENEGNKEMIMVVPAKSQEGFGNWFTAGSLPPNFKTSTQVPAFVWQAGMANFATQYRLRNSLVNSFDLVNDKRAILVLRSYTNIAGANVNLMTTPDNARSLKYWDNGTVGNHSGNDIPVIRYADILITRAEALNELNGPTQEALNLINLVRTRAGIANLTLSVASSKEILRDLILEERGKEFYTEAKRREDLLRHGKFISLALARGISVAANKHNLFPIPQAEIDANTLAVQNPGY